MLDLDVWKWAALIEHWAHAHVQEGKEGELTWELNRQVHFTWIGDMQANESEQFGNPLNWQKNEPGELLVGGNRKKRKE